MEINEKDIVSFARVLVSLGKRIEKEPEILMQVLNMPKELKIETNSSSNLPQAESIQIYEIAQSKTKEEFVKHLKQFTSEQLRDVIKFNGFGSVRYKAIERLADYIADEVKKRSVDVFRHHE
jgi:hypothetical protein